MFSSNWVLILATGKLERYVQRHIATKTLLNSMVGNISYLINDGVLVQAAMEDKLGIQGVFLKPQPKLTLMHPFEFFILLPLTLDLSLYWLRRNVCTSGL